MEPQIKIISTRKYGKKTFNWIEIIYPDGRRLRNFDPFTGRLTKAKKEYYLKIANHTMEA